MENIVNNIRSRTEINNIARCIIDYKSVIPPDSVNNITLRNDEYVNVYHKTIPINFDSKEYKFECYVYKDKDNIILTSIYLNNEKNPIIDFDEWNHQPIVNIYPKKYCIEILGKKDNELWINFIQKKVECMLPDIRGTNCMGLGGILKLIFTFLDKIGYVGNIYLEDESQILGQPTLIPRLLLCKDSIYSRYGFKPDRSTSDMTNHHLLLDELQHTQINISPISKIYKLMPPEIISLQNNTMSLFNLAKIFSNPTSKEEADRNNEFFVNLDKEIKEKINTLKRYYTKMINTNYKLYMECDIMKGGGKENIKDYLLDEYKRKYHKYKHKYITHIYNKNSNKKMKT